MGAMRTDTPQPIRLSDYRPPAFLVDEVRLDGVGDDRVPLVGDAGDVLVELAGREGAHVGQGTPVAPTELEQAFARVLDGLEPGDVITYGEVALEAGYPGRSRAVGRYLSEHGGDHPWWRVVNASGRLAPGKEAEQARRQQAGMAAAR